VEGKGTKVALSGIKGLYTHEVNFHLLISEEVEHETAEQWESREVSHIFPLPLKNSNDGFDTYLKGRDLSFTPCYHQTTFWFL